MSFSNLRRLSKQKMHNLLVDRYKPKKIADIIGNTSAVKALLHYLQTFEQIKSVRRAVLLAGPPGIGKSTMAHVVAREAGFDVVELNASDVRNRKALRETLAGLAQNSSVVKALCVARGKPVSRSRSVLVMDEVDGMSTGDRGGTTELIALIKRSRVPVVLICNDKTNPRFRPLFAYTEDLRVRRPTAQQLLPFVMRVAVSERIPAERADVSRLLEVARGDLRSVLNTLALWQAAGRPGEVWEHAKDPRNTVFEAAGLLFRTPDKRAPAVFRSANWVREKKALYFSDYSLVPLMVHENYINYKAAGGASKRSKGDDSVFRSMAVAADFLSYGDSLDALVRRSQNYAYLGQHALFAAVFPATMVSASFGGQMLRFSGLLGLTSKTNKHKRLLLQGLEHAVRVQKEDWGLELEEFRLFRADFLESVWIEHLLQGDAEAAVRLMEEWALTKEDLENIGKVKGEGLCARSFAQVSAKTKTALAKLFKTTQLYKSLAEPAIKGNRKSPFVSSKTNNSDEESSVEAIEDSEGEDVLLV